MKKKERAQYLKWYGGCVAKIYPGAARIRIAYDDGTKEIADFPDKEIVIDDDYNGQHHAPDDEEEFIDENSRKNDVFVPAIEKTCTPVNSNIVHDNHWRDIERKLLTTPLPKLEPRIVADVCDTSIPLSQIHMSKNEKVNNISSVSSNLKIDTKSDATPLNESHISAKKETEESKKGLATGISPATESKTKVDDNKARFAYAEHLQSSSSIDSPFTPSTIMTNSSILSQNNLGSFGNYEIGTANSSSLNSSNTMIQPSETLSLLNIKVSVF